MKTIKRLKLSENNINDTISSEAYIIINSRKNFDGWWNINQLINQVYTLK